MSRFRTVYLTCFLVLSLGSTVTIGALRLAGR
jgi:hypothetical protein